MRTCSLAGSSRRECADETGCARDRAIACRWRASLPDPYLELHSGDGSTIASNDNWKDNLAGGSQEVAIENTRLAPTNDLESALLGVLDPGGYTAIVRGANNGTGVGLVEVYSLGAASMDLSSEAHLANISTRGLVQTGDNVMIGGFINQGATPIKVLVRGIGPSLTPYGVSGALANPTLELHEPDGSVVTNDDWMTDPTQKADIMATGLAPTNTLESAILVTLPVGEGAYTAIVSGAQRHDWRRSSGGLFWEPVPRDIMPVIDLKHSYPFLKSSRPVEKHAEHDVVACAVPARLPDPAWTADAAIRGAHAIMRAGAGDSPARTLPALGATFAVDEASRPRLKFVAASRRNQHAGRVHSPKTACRIPANEQGNPSPSARVLSFTIEKPGYSKK